MKKNKLSEKIAKIIFKAFFRTGDLETCKKQPLYKNEIRSIYRVVDKVISLLGKEVKAVALGKWIKKRD